MPGRPPLLPDRPSPRYLKLEAKLPFGAPAAYWLDLRDYHLAEVAAGLGTR